MKAEANRVIGQVKLWDEQDVVAQVMAILNTEAIPEQVVIPNEVIPED